MMRGSDFFWLVLGFVISVIDAWLSIQSMFGILSPVNSLSYVAAVIVGITLTVIAVCAPIVGEKTKSPLPRILWFVILLIDIGTSFLGAIWYGVMRNPLNSMIVFSEIRYDPGNWFETSIFFAFVLIVAACCYRFGQALNRFKRHNQYAEGKRRISSDGISGDNGGAGGRAHW